ncbi:MAG: hypothetical protein H6936_08710 [Burkholderiales bacterium]|nr:hypothetical protein [Burkholderiales bacterium]
MNFVTCEPPALDTLEVSLFGTGIGEGLAIHLGNSEWALIDTCRADAKGIPLNLAYLESIGIDVTKSVKIVVATHWHDDHVDGLSYIVDRCQNAELVFPSAITCDEFHCIVQLYANQNYILDREKSGVKEMAKALQILMNRRETKPNIYRAPKRAQADHFLFRNSYSQLHAISPSSEAIQLATEEMAAMWKTIENQSSSTNKQSISRDSIAAPKRNLNAVALWLRWRDDKRVLLGSDLEEHGQPLLGWQAALSCKQFPDGKASIFKIPHHGSPNGDYNEVWNQIIRPDDPVAILTAYARGIAPRPSIEDIARIRKKTNQFYYTTLPSNTKEKYSSAVEKTISGIVKRRQSLRKYPGQIQIRWEDNKSIQIRYSGSAGKIFL